MLRHGLVLIGGLVIAAPVTAQSVIVNPTTVQFTPSADHAVVLPDGQPMVASYEARYALEGSATVVCTTNLGKPTPVSSVISMPLPLSCVPTSPSARYVVRVAAVGPTGSGLSGPSGPFASVGSPGAPGVPVLSKP
jgi:hypothetical protein